MRIGLLSIGQSPRPDLVQTLPLPSHVEWIEAGALDGLQPEDIPAAGGLFPLATRLADGTQVVVDERFLIAHLQNGVARLERAGVAAILLMCAGTFAGVQSAVPLFKPFDLVSAALHDWGMQRVLVVCPFAGQDAPMRDRWQAAGFDTQVMVARPDEAVNIAATAAQAAAQCVVLDYFGHRSDEVTALRAALTLPLIDVGSFAATVLASTL